MANMGCTHKQLFTICVATPPICVCTHTHREPTDSPRVNTTMVLVDIHAKARSAGTCSRLPTGEGVATLEGRINILSARLEALSKVTANRAKK